jgi:hypothetical protein
MNENPYELIILGTIAACRGYPGNRCWPMAKTVGEGRVAGLQAAAFAKKHR